MIIHFEDKIKEWYNEGEPINKMLLGGYVIYQRLTDCSPHTDKMYRWITLSGDTDYICQNFNKYEKQQKQYSVDSGETWINFNPPIYRAGDVIEYDSEDCGYIPRDYRWVNLDPSTDFYCVETTKYFKQKKQYSEDGVHWIDVIPYEYKRGDIAEEKSADCGYIEPQYREISGDPYCNGVDKVFDLMNQVSYDGGITWITTSTVMTLIEKNSEDCGYVPPQPIYRWAYVDISDPYCNGVSTYYKQKRQISYDNGQTWEDVIPLETRRSNLFYGYLTEQCGWDENTGVIKFGGRAFTYNSPCNENILPTGDITSYHACRSKFFSNDDRDWYYIITGDTMPQLRGVYGGYVRRNIVGIVIPRCVKHIPDNCFDTANNGGEGGVVIGLSEGLETIGRNAFSGLLATGSLSVPIVIPSTVKSIGKNAFNFEYNSGISGTLKLIFKGTTPPEMGEIIDSGIRLFPSKYQIFVPVGCLNAYRAMLPDIYHSNIFEQTIPTYPNMTMLNEFEDICGNATKRFTAEYDFSPHYICQEKVLTRMTSCFGSGKVLDSSELTFGKSDDYYFQYNTIGNISALTIYDEIIQGIGSSLFKDSTKLKYVDMPSSISQILSYVFSGCTNLSTVIVRATVPPRLGFDVFKGTPDTMRIYVPDESIGAYLNAWSSLADKLRPLSELP